MSKRLSNDLVRNKPKHPRKRLKLTIPHAPSVNLMYRYVRGRKVLTRQAISYIKAVQTIAEREVRKQSYQKEEKGVWMVVELKYFYPDRKIRDSHNMIKIIMDSLEGFCFENDAYARVVESFVGMDRDNPRIEVEIYPSNYEKDLREVEECGSK